MKTPLSFYFIAAVAGALACSDEGGTDRNTGGTGGTTPVGSAGSGSGQAGSSQGTAGTSSVGNGGSGGAGSGMNYGPLLDISGSGADVVVQDLAGNTNITGGIILAQSAMMTVPAEITVHEGQLCMKGTTAVVVDNNYGVAWGAELSLDLNRAANPAAGGDAGAVADAGGDAGGDVLGTVAEPWPIGNVIGFSYKITGMDPALPGSGVSPAAFRFKAVPQGANTEIDTYCSTRTPINNATENVLFSQILFECWTTTNPSIAAPMLTYNVGAQGMPSMRENPNALMSISWQVPADPMIAHQFDFCISELRTIVP